jgi:periplasmic divalent cation tolerance protein
MNTYIQIRTTTDSKEAAKTLASLLIEQNLVACAQISGPIQSRYAWKGEVTTTEEWLLAAKTRSDLFERTEQTIKKNHGYELPEIIAYLWNWSATNTPSGWRSS